MMYQLTDSGAVIGCVPKGASQSIRATCHNRVEFEQARNADVRVFFIRNPAARMVSAYCFFKTIYQHDVNVGQGSPTPDDVATWASFIEFVRGNPDNPHWSPQMPMVREFSPTHIHRLENIGSVWPIYHSAPMQHINASQPFEVGEIPADLMARYTEDSAVWHG